jgi:hypothetical protein
MSMFDVRKHVSNVMHIYIYIYYYFPSTTRRHGSFAGVHTLLRILGYYRSTRTAWLVTQWTEVPPTSGAHLFVVAGSGQIVYKRAKISASSFK